MPAYRCVKHGMQIASLFCEHAAAAIDWDRPLEDGEDAAAACGATTGTLCYIQHYVPSLLAAVP